MDADTVIVGGVAAFIGLGILTRIPWGKLIPPAPKPVNTNPPVWPPRRPDDWGRELLVAHQKAMRKYQARQSLARASNVPLYESPPMQPMIPSWEAHNRALQAHDPYQIRWAQTESGDWHRLAWGNRALAKAGEPTPVFQSMQRADTGEWVWIQIGNVKTVRFDWQRCEVGIEEVQVVGDTGTYKVIRPIGHPSHQQVEVQRDNTTYGVADPMSDEELANINAASEIPGAAPVGPAPAPAKATKPVTHGSSQLMTDEQLNVQNLSGIL